MLLYTISYPKSNEVTMKHALVVTSYIDHPETLPLAALRSLASEEEVTVICADGGYRNAEALGIRPDILIGDYDSSARPDPEAVKAAGEDMILLPKVKDMTDSEAAIDLAASRGAERILVLGGLGGRFDHAMGNVGMLAKYCGKSAFSAFLDGQNLVYMLAPGTYELPRTLLETDYTYLGLIAYAGPVRSLSIRGCKYTLDRHDLTPDTTLGVSNEILGEKATISFEDGKLLVIHTRDIDKSQ